MEKKKTQKKNEKKSMAVAKKSPTAAAPAMEFTITISDDDVADFIKTDTSKAFADMTREIQLLRKAFPMLTIPSFVEDCAAIGCALSAARAALIEGQKKPSKPQKGNAKPVKPAAPAKKPAALSNLEKARIKELRKNGIAIKAIAKELHRSDRPIAAYVKSIEKAGKKK